MAPPANDLCAGRGSAKSVGQRFEHGAGARLPGLLFFGFGGARVGGGAGLRGRQRLSRRPRLVGSSAACVLASSLDADYVPPRLASHHVPTEPRKQNPQPWYCTFLTSSIRPALC